MEGILNSIATFTDDNDATFELCPETSPSNQLPTVFPKKMKLGEIRAAINVSLRELHEQYPGKKRVTIMQRLDQIRAQYVRVGRIPGTQLHIFLFYRDPENSEPKKRFSPVPLSLLPLFHKSFKLVPFNDIVAVRGEEAFKVLQTETLPGFAFPTVDARLWSDRYRKNNRTDKGKPSTKKRKITKDAPDEIPSRPTKRTKRKSKDVTPVYFDGSMEGQEQLRAKAIELGLEAVANPKTRELVDLVGIEHGDGSTAIESFDVIPGSQMLSECRPLCAEDFSSFVQSPQTNYFLSMLAGLPPERMKMMAFTKVKWRQTPSIREWSPSTLVATMLRSVTRRRNFDAIIRRILGDSVVTAGLGINLDSEHRNTYLEDSTGDNCMSEDYDDTDNGQTSKEELLLKHKKTVEALQDHILRLAMEPYCAKLFSK
jgi:hypothetical protein